MGFGIYKPGEDKIMGSSEQPIGAYLSDWVFRLVGDTCRQNWCISRQIRALTPFQVGTSEEMKTLLLPIISDTRKGPGTVHEISVTQNGPLRYYRGNVKYIPVKIEARVSYQFRGPKAETFSLQGDFNVDGFKFDRNTLKLLR
ncbi:MAG: hypothetical protein IH861_07735 [Chloroflexi bacterium]|nr:hypothetical protein [Chloroflexota bacterium]